MQACGAWPQATVLNDTEGAVQLLNCVDGRPTIEAGKTKTIRPGHACSILAETDFLLFGVLSATRGDYLGCLTFPRESLEGEALVRVTALNEAKSQPECADTGRSP